MNDREQMRRAFYTAWQKKLAAQTSQSAEPLQPLEELLAQIISEHPEYHQLLSDNTQLNKEWFPEAGETNPFLHMSMHLTIREQISTNSPAGISTAYQNLLNKLKDQTETEHAMMECVGEMLWQAQRNNTQPDFNHYIKCVTKLSNS